MTGQFSTIILLSGEQTAWFAWYEQFLAMHILYDFSWVCQWIFFTHERVDKQAHLSGYGPQDDKYFRMNWVYLSMIVIQKGGCVVDAGMCCLDPPFKNEGLIPIAAESNAGICP